MRLLLVAMGPSIPGDGLLAGVQALRAAGHRVELVSRRAPSPRLSAELDARTPLPGPRVQLPGIRAGKLRIDPDRLPGAWRLARHPSTREAVTTAEVLVAVDQAAIPAVWWAARRRARRGRPPLAALSGVPAAQNRFTLPPS